MTTCGACGNFRNGTWVGQDHSADRRGDLFAARRAAPTKGEFKSTPGQELDTLSIHIAVEPFLADA